MEFGPQGGPEWLTLYYDPALDAHVVPPPGQHWLRTAWYLVPSDRETARLFYEGAKERFLYEGDGGSAFFGPAVNLEMADPGGVGYGLCLALELGDGETATRLLRCADARFEPTWDEERGEFFYRFGLDEPYPRGQLNDGIMPGFALDEGAWWRLFNEPDRHRFEEPTVCGVDYPRVGVRTAAYEAEARRIVVVTDALPSATGAATSFRVTGAAGLGHPEVVCDGSAHDRCRVEAGDVLVEATAGAHRFVVTWL